MNIKYAFVGMLLLASPCLFAASSQFLNVESILVDRDPSAKVLPYSINVVSFTHKVNASAVENLEKLDSELIYFTKVEVNNVIYYRLVVGNFASLKQAKQQLKRVRKFYPGAWINIRKNVEKLKLTKLLSPANKKKRSEIAILPPVPAVAMPAVTAMVTPKPVPEVIPEPPKKFTPRVSPTLDVKIAPGNTVKKSLDNVAKSPLTPAVEFAEKLLEQARQHFLDRDYAPVITISEKVIETGSTEQKQRAMELVGIARERQRKFSQAVAIYTDFLELYPDSELARKIKIRLTGLKTMRMDPKSRLVKNRRQKSKDSWNMHGSLSQYYRDDVLDTETEDSQKINSSLVTDVNYYARKKTEKSALVLRFDAGLVNDFIDDKTQTRISRAMVNYINNEADYQLIGGRQSRTAKGVFGRFDGFVYKGLSHPGFDYSLYTGFPVQSSFDGLDSERQFVGGSINFKPLEKVEMDVYFVQQQVSGLKDRQALGTEFQYRNNKGFLYGIIDYDIFYKDLNNITAITNYRYTDNWVFNLTYDYRNSPLLTTLNALQGQSVATIDELQDLFSEREIYQLAEDRSSKSQNLFFGSNYQIDENRQLYLSLSLSTIEEGIESGGVAAVPSTSDTNLSADYTVKRFFGLDEYTTLGSRVSDSSSSEIISISIRSRFAGSKGWRYDPRLTLDYRQSKTSEVDQYIIKPSFKVAYKPNKKISFEASLGIEYSNFKLPELNDQTQYDLFLGYVYRF